MGPGSLCSDLVKGDGVISLQGLLVLDHADEILLEITGKVKMKGVSKVGSFIVHC